MQRIFFLTLLGDLQFLVNAFCIDFHNNFVGVAQGITDTLVTTIKLSTLATVYVCSHEWAVKVCFSLVLNLNKESALVVIELMWSLINKVLSIWTSSC